MKRVVAILFLLTCCGVASAQVVDTHTLVPPVLLNHVYLTLEANTYNAIVNSEFIKTTFASGGERTVTSNTSWTGLYLLQ